MSENTVNKETYQEFIDEDIQYIEKYFPKESLNKRHIIEVLQWSVNQLYPDNIKTN